MNLNAVSQETLDQMAEPLQKALSQGFTTALGLTGYELSAPAKFLVPVLSPFRNSLPRSQAPVGSTASTWRAITGINVTAKSPAVGFGFAGPLVSTSTQNYVAAYAPLALGDSVQMDAQVMARGFDDLRSRSGTNLLYALMIAEDQMLLGSQNFSLGTPTAVVATAGTTGGSIGATATVHIRVAARTVENFWFGGGTLASADATVTTSAGTTNTVGGTVAAVVGAVAYDWYVGNSTTNLFFWATTSTNVMPSCGVLPVADNTTNAVPPGAIAARAGAGTNLSSFTDSSADPNAFNGLIGSLIGDAGTGGNIVQRGTGSPSNAYVASLNGAAFTESQGSVNEIDAALMSLWNTARISPTRMLMSAQQHQDVSNHIVHSGGAMTMYDPSNLAQRQNGVGGGFINTYVNKAANGAPIDLVTEPNMPVGTVVIVSDNLPYPDNQVTVTMDVETQQEYQQLEYPPARVLGNNLGGPRYDLEVRAIENMRVFAPFTNAVISNIAAG